MTSRRPSFGTALAVVTALAAATLAVRAAAPTNFHSKDQPKIGMYVIDMLDNGRWFLPRSFDEVAELATKPPLLAWMAAGVSAAARGITELTVRVPVVLAFLATVLLTLWIGSQVCSVRVGLLGAVMVTLCYHVLNHAWIARPDMLLAGLIWIAIACLVGLERAPGERRGRWRLGFWIATTLSVLDKGPIGPVVILAVAVADHAWQRRLREVRPLLWPFWGLLGMLAVVSAWFIPTLFEGGEQYWRHVIRGEMLQRIWGGGEMAGRARGPHYYFIYALARMAPWTAALILGLPTLWRHRRGQRQRVRPLIWSGAIYLALSIPASKRADYILPIYPALGLVIGQIMVGWQARWRRRGGPTLASGGWNLLVGLLGIGFGLGVLTLLVTQRGQAISGDAPEAQLIFHRMRAIAPLTAVFALVALAGGVLALASLRRGPLWGSFIGASLLTFAYLQLVFWAFASSASEQSGVRIAAFCEEVNQILPPESRVGYLDPHCFAARFYLRRLDRDLTDEGLRELLAMPGWALITRPGSLPKLSEILGSAPFHIAAESEFVLTARSTLILVTAGPPPA